LKEDDVNKKPVLMCFILALAPVMEPSARLIRVSPGVFSQSSEQPSATYTITDLGTLGGNDSVFTSDINASGQVVGATLRRDEWLGYVYRAFLWQNGVMTDLGTLGGTSSYAAGINASGQVVGWASTTNSSSRAFLWQDGVMTDLGTLGGTLSGAHAINASGQVVGWASTTNGTYYAFLWQNGVMTDLGRPGWAIDINASGQVVGETVDETVDWDDWGDVYHAFLWQNGVMTELGVPEGALYSGATAINAPGQVVGATVYANESWGYVQNAFLWQNGVMTSLGALVAEDINTLGQVVGAAETGTGYHAFLWQNGVTTDLNTVLPPGSGWVLSWASAINDSGQIAGSGSFNNQPRAFLLTPVTQQTVAFTVEPQTFAAGEIHHTQQFIRPTFTALVREPGPPACQIEQDAGRQQSQRPGLGRVVHHHRKPLEGGLRHVVGMFLAS
jgi:probable HAF family extracellular repeat protein